MCIIAIKTKNAKITDQAIRTMYQRNPDGAGYMVADGKRIKIRKGFFKVEHFIQQYRKDERTAVTAVLHFRIATHGKTDAARCHPFPLTSDYNLLDKTSLDLCRGIGVAHNGIYSIKTDGVHSDTQTAIARLYTPLLSSNIDKGTASEIIENINGNCRLVFLAKDGSFTKYGEWEEDGGVWYSNNTYKPVQYSYFGYSGGYGARSLRYWTDAKILDEAASDNICNRFCVTPPCNDGALAVTQGGMIVRRWSKAGDYHEITRASADTYKQINADAEKIPVMGWLD